MVHAGKIGESLVRKENMGKPLISVIITVYNTSPYLNKCVDSVLDQNSDSIEIIFVNDGSTDDSLEICQCYAEKYENIVIIDKINGGASDARNAGLLKAKGEYIHFIDSDDFIIYDSLYVDIAKIVGKHRPDIVFALDKEFTTEEYKEYGRMPLYTNEGYFEGNVLHEVLQNKYVMTLTCPVNKIFNRNFLLENKLLFTVGLDHEEDEWLPRVIACSRTAFFLNEFIYGVRVGRQDSLSNSFSEEILARKGRSKMIIADTGMEYMKGKCIDDETLRLIAGHYWEYMVGAVTNTVRLKDKEKRTENFNFIRERKRFFKNYPLLLNRNQRIMGWMFLHLGIEFTSVIVGKRYRI